MITTKRQIRNDTDRFGGYGTESVKSPLISDYEIGNTHEPSVDNSKYNIGNSLIMTDADINIANPAPQTQAAQPMYTTLNGAQTKTEKLTDVPSRPVKEEKPREREDILPTLKTRKYAVEKNEIDEARSEEHAPTRKGRRTLDTRTKVLLCVYIVVALVLAIAVIATGASISAASAQADEVSMRISQKQAIIAEQEAAIAGLLDEGTIYEKAIDNGMVKAGEPVYNAPATATVTYPEATPHTNGFDKLCDWVSDAVN